MTPYEIWKGKQPYMKHFHDFGNPCYILNIWEPREKCHFLEEVQTIAGTDQHLNEHDYRGLFGSQTREPLKKIQKNHPAFDIIGNPKGSVPTQGIPKMKQREMIGLSCNASTSKSKNYKEALNDEFLINIVPS